MLTEPMHRYVAFGFYAIDIAILFMNSIVDFGVNTGEQLVWWKQFYLTNIMPATPLFALIASGALFLLDPSARAHIMHHQLREAIRTAKAQQILDAANADNVSAAVHDAARAEVDSVLTELFGRKVTTFQSTTDVPTLEDKPDGANFQS